MLIISYFLKKCYGLFKQNVQFLIAFLNQKVQEMLFFKHFKQIYKYQYIPIIEFLY